MSFSLPDMTTIKLYFMPMRFFFCSNIHLIEKRVSCSILRSATYQPPKFACLSAGCHPESVSE